MTIRSRDSTASETHSILATAWGRSTDNDTNGSSDPSTGAKAGIAIAAIYGVAMGVFLYLCWRRRNLRKTSSLESGNDHTSRQQWPPQKQLDKQHKHEHKQLQSQRQYQLQNAKLKLREARQKQLLKGQKEQYEESKSVAELFQLPGWMPERRTLVNELADTGQPRYKITTEEIIAEPDGGCLQMDNENHHIYGHHPWRPRYYTTEISRGTPVPPDPADDDEELPPRDRSRSDGGSIISPISPADHMPDFRRAFSLFDVSPSTPTMPGTVFSRDDWRLGKGAQLPTPSLYPNLEPATP